MHLVSNWLLWLVSSGSLLREFELSVLKGLMVLLLAGEAVHALVQGIEIIGGNSLRLKLLLLRGSHVSYWRMIGLYYWLQLQ